MNDYAGVILAVFLLAFNAFFVGAEFALISARRSQIEPRAQAGSRVAKITLGAMENVSLVMAGAQLGITICSLGLGAVGEPALAHLLKPGFEALNVPDQLTYPISFVLALTIVVYLHVVLGEMVPKNIALAGPERSALILGPPMVAVVWVLKPIILTLNAIANLTLRMIGIEPKDEVTSSFTREEVAALVEESRGEGLIHQGEYDRLAGALGFTERTVESVLMPLETLVTVPRGCTGADVEEVCASTGYSRFPVHEATETTEPTEATVPTEPTGVAGERDLIGYLHIKDVLQSDEDRRNRAVDPKWIRAFATVSPSDTLHEALETLQRKGAHLARVVDEQGRVVGLAALEDVLEELVGEIRDAAHQEETVGL